jgi:hypothetical protein
VLAYKQPENETVVKILEANSFSLLYSVQNQLWSPPNLLSNVYQRVHYVKVTVVQTNYSPSSNDKVEDMESYNSNHSHVFFRRDLLR